VRLSLKIYCSNSSLIIVLVLIFWVEFVVGYLRCTTSSHVGALAKCLAPRPECKGRPCPLYMTPYTHPGHVSLARIFGRVRFENLSRDESSSTLGIHPEQPGRLAARLAAWVGIVFITWDNQDVTRVGTLVFDWSPIRSDSRVWIELGLVLNPTKCRIFSQSPITSKILVIFQLYDYTIFVRKLTLYNFDLGKDVKSETHSWNWGWPCAIIVRTSNRQTWAFDVVNAVERAWKRS
jgi:hypothetical protein